MTQPVLIGIDWGTSNLRVFRIGEGGVVLDQRADPRGAGGLAPTDFAPVMAEVAGDWIKDSLPILVCGMAGAQDRWAAVPYRPCPAELSDIAAGLVQPADSPVRLVPGVGRDNADGLQDVMRGEETQILGLLSDPGASARVVLPGTHSKWATVQNGRVTDFRTFMTGELFGAIRKATILGGGMGEPGVDDAAFKKGVLRGLSEPAVTAALFSVRIEKLSGRLQPESLADYLSGLLIGAEIGAQKGPSEPLMLIGSDALVARYVRALYLAGFTDVSAVGGADITARGLWRIWKASQQ